jgi:hypothetical protein
VGVDQSVFYDRVFSALLDGPANLEVATGINGQCSGQCAHERAPADALVAARRAECSSSPSGCDRWPAARRRDPPRGMTPAFSHSHSHSASHEPVALRWRIHEGIFFEVLHKMPNIKQQQKISIHRPAIGLAKGHRTSHSKNRFRGGPLSTNQSHRCGGPERNLSKLK